MDELSHIQVSLSSVVALLVSLASLAFAGFAFLGRTAKAAVLANLEKRFTDLEESSAKEATARAKALETERATERAAAEERIANLKKLHELETKLGQLEGKILALEKSDEETHAAQVEFREKAISIALFEREMKHQNAILEKQGTTLEKVVERLGRTRTMSQELPAAVSDRGVRALAPPMAVPPGDERRDPPTDRPFDRRR